MSLRIPELDALDPPMWLDGDELHYRPADQRSAMAYYDREGRPLVGEFIDVARQSALLKQAPGGLVHTAIAVEGDRELFVSTTYLGIDHGWFMPSDMPAPPIIWGTMIFSDDWIGEYQWRYATQAAAMRNHHEVVDILCRALHTNVLEEVDRPPSGWTQ